MGVRVGADVGGTFTKAVAIDSVTGELAGCAVVPTTHDHRDGVSAGVVDVVAKLVAEVGAESIELVTHSTTQAVTALLEGDTVPVGVLGMGRPPYLRKARNRTTISRAIAHEYLDLSAGFDAGVAREALIRLAGAGAVCVAEAFASDDSACEDAVAALAAELVIGDGVIVEVGGTSTNVAAITAGRPALSYVRVAGQATAVRALDVQVAGVAGGSMLRVRRRRIYGVGPRSAHIAGLPYSCFLAPERLAGARPETLVPRPGDPADYLAVSRPTRADVDTLIAEVEAEALAAGASPTSLQVQVNHITDRGAIRAAAVGALVLGSGVVPGRPPLSREAIIDVARATGGSEQVDLVGRFWLSSLDGRVLIFDRFGDPTLDVRGEAILVNGSAGEGALEATIGSVVSRHVRSVGPIRAQPTTWVIQDDRIRELTDPNAIADTVGTGAAAVIVGCA